MMPGQVTVFGASGFLGRHVVRRLAGQGVRIVAAVRDAEAAAFLRPMGDVGQIVPFPCDVTREEMIRRALEGSDAAVNLVGILHESGRQRFQSLHAEAPARIAACLAETGRQAFVHVSALGADADSDSAYARSKAQGEAAACQALPETVILRPGIVFGPEDDFFNRFAALARLSPVLPLFGGGESRFQPVYVGDVAEAVLAGLRRPAFRGRCFELGGPAIYSFRSLMEMILAETGRRRLLLPLPFFLADVLGFFGDGLASLGLRPPITRDQARLLRRDTVVAEGAEGLAELSIAPSALELELPCYLDRFRPTGRFGPPRTDPRP